MLIFAEDKLHLGNFKFDLIALDLRYLCNPAL